MVSKASTASSHPPQDPSLFTAHCDEKARTKSQQGAEQDQGRKFVSISPYHSPSTTPTQSEPHLQPMPMKR